MKKKLIGIVGTVMIALVIFAGVVLYISNGKLGIELEQKGKEIFGTEYCKANHDREM